MERAITNEAEEIIFLYVTRDRYTECHKMLNEIRPLWDRPWEVSFSNLDSARLCYLVDEFTASVFHSMRAAEKVLTTLAKSLSLDPSRENWQPIIEQIEASVKKLDDLPKGEEKEKKQTFYSETAMQLRYIKNAWRNHVMHGRHEYKEKDAREIWFHVKRIVEKASCELEEALDT